MTIDPGAILAHDFCETRQRYTERDVILYALGLGFGAGEDDLPFVFETDLRVLPTFAVTLASPGMWIRAPRFGVDFTQLVHSEQRAWFHNAIPANGEIIGTARVVALTDRGIGKGAVLTLERNIRDAASGLALCTLHQTLLLRGDGGFGGTMPERAASGIPDRTADLTASTTLSPRAALIYRLSGDWNPLHVDPAMARAAGFNRPIMHGLGSYGIAAVAVSRAAGASPRDIKQLACRFSGVVMPGDSLDFRIWHVFGAFAFTAYVGDRKVLDDGLLTLES
jgi:acyl dehydratase